MSNPELTDEPSAFDTKARALLRAMPPVSAGRSTATRKLARGLGWFSLGLGLAEVLATRPLARWAGLQGHEALLRRCGMREIVSGLGILVSREPRPMAAWMWTRVAGDALDVSTLGTAAMRPNPPDGHPIVALMSVAGVTALDLTCVRTLELEGNAARQTTDYSDRSGIASTPDSMRGAALETFRQPGDMQGLPAPDRTAMH